ncbi:hypothetical protein [Kribbella deserti]|uniref:YtkA-like domain-containing protein n=1 Tax=Kribbella deserti TaxID=1926257 RepID=A0ABV6QNU4_9ACTN
MSATTRRSTLVLICAAVILAVAGYVVVRQLGSAETALGAAAEAKSSRYAVQLWLPDHRVGEIDSRVVVKDLNGGPAAVRAVSLESAMPSMGHATAVVQALPEGENTGAFGARGELFPMSGVWEVTVRLDTADGPDAATVTVSVQN